MMLAFPVVRRTKDVFALETWEAMKPKPVSKASWASMWILVFQDFKITYAEHSSSQKFSIASISTSSIWFTYLR